MYDFGTRAETRLTRGPQGDHSPRFSPDGRQLAFVRGGRELRVLDLGSRQERLLATAALEQVPITADRPWCGLRMGGGSPMRPPAGGCSATST